MAAAEGCSLSAQWRPVSLTHVEYPEGDVYGQLLAYLSLLPIFILVSFVTLIIFKRELHTISFLGGLVMNEGVNWLIKNIVREPRPCEGTHSTVTTEYGLPSSHSQFMWFFFGYSFLFLYLRMHQTNNARFLDLLWRHVLSLCLLTAACLVSYSRPISEFFLIRDTSLIPNILWFEYTVTRSEARNRQRKLGTKLQ
ncbi:PREDICTED: dolichyldiphosphatase 1 isoform X2 [Nanorana parkeri]|uniref:dolichyldiphosphatase 1 isoform X2 n=1 Tax=Nanorana parkeri TaxID=125878 RepID=UPI0008549758|nr:PREDICTED: dolichyldiphosphatase 1 isoform X2 [Nanorana parkeri]